MPGFILATARGVGGVGRVVEKPLAAAQAFDVGAPLLVDANGAFAECGTNPTAVAAVSEAGAGADTSGFNRFASKSFPPGYMQGTAVKDRVFRVGYAGTLPAADGGTYGITRNTGGVWVVDFAKNAANQVVKLVGRLTNSPENQPVVLVKFLDTVVQDV